MMHYCSAAQDQPCVSAGDWPAKCGREQCDMESQRCKSHSYQWGTCCSGSLRRTSTDAYLCSRVKQLHCRHADGLREL